MQTPGESSQLLATRTLWAPVDTVPRTAFIGLRSGRRCISATFSSGPYVSTRLQLCPDSTEIRSLSRPIDSFWVSCKLPDASASRVFAMYYAF